MSASDHLGLQFSYSPPEMGRNSHMLRASIPGQEHEAGSLEWGARGIRFVEVARSNRRQGVATALWNEGHRLAENHGRIPKPKHSAERTDEGDAWARSVGGRLPRRNWD